MVSGDQFVFADFEPEIAEHGDNGADYDLCQLHQAALHDRGQPELSQEPDVGHRHLEKV